MTYGAQVLFIIMTVLLTACSDSATELNFPAMPRELSDCRVYLVTNASGSIITIVRCPNSQTTTNTDIHQGKTHYIDVVFVGETKK